MRDRYGRVSERQETGFMANFRARRDSRLKILWHPESAQALEELTNEQFARQESRGMVRKFFGATFHIAKSLAVPAAIGAGFGALTGNMDAVKDGAYYGATLEGAYVLGYSFFYALPKKLAGHKLSVGEKKERIAEYIKIRLDSKRIPATTVLSGVAIASAFYFGVSLGIDLIVPTDNILDTIKVDNGLAARIGAVEGTIIGLSSINTGRKWYNALQRRISEISGIVEGDYRDVTPNNRQPPASNKLHGGR